MSLTLTFWIGVIIFGILNITTNIYVAIIVTGIYAYFIFKQRRNIFTAALIILLEMKKESVVVELSLIQIKNIVIAFGYVDRNIGIENGFTFNVDEQKFIVSQVARNKTRITLA